MLLNLATGLRREIGRQRKIAAFRGMERKGGDDFAGSIMRLIAEARRRKLASPVIEYPTSEIGIPRRFDVRRATRIASHVLDHAAQVNASAALLADDESRELLRRLFAFRALGPMHVRLPRADRIARQRAAARATFQRPSEEEFPPFPMGHYRWDAEEGPIALECWEANVRASFIEQQYWFRRGDNAIRPELGDIVLDCGACFGDTAIAFAQAVGPEGSVHAFEPMADQRTILARNLASNPELARRIKVHEAAVDEASGRELLFSGGAGGRPSETGERVVTTTIDDTVEQEGLERVDFIKMDIEGAEMPALRGGAKTITRFRPKLAISIYHSVEELTAIPRLVSELAPGYRMYIEHHTGDIYETILYAAPAETD